MSDQELIDAMKTTESEMVKQFGIRQEDIMHLSVSGSGFHASVWIRRNGIRDHGSSGAFKPTAQEALQAAFDEIRNKPVEPTKEELAEFRKWKKSKYAAEQGAESTAV